MANTRPVIERRRCNIRPQRGRGDFRACRRRGLAPLEFVIALPILVGLMALMVNYGVATAWRLRAQSAAMTTLESFRQGPSPQGEVAPPLGPVKHRLGVERGSLMAELDEPRLRSPIARGPIGSFATNSALFDPTRELVVGECDLRRKHPLMSSLGTYSFEIRLPKLVSTWSYREMGLADNAGRRFFWLHLFPKADARLAGGFVRALVEILQAPYRPALAPLDRDPDGLAALGMQPDFHPRVDPFSSTDRQAVREVEVANLIDRIQGRKEPFRVAGVPEQVARFQRDIARKQRSPEPIQEEWDDFLRDL